jgi:hypothetical protein
MGRKRRILLILLVAAVAILGTLAWYDRWFAGEPELVSDLPRELSKVDAAFKQRIASRFPIGSPNELLVRTLSDQGFRREWNTRGARQVATYRSAVGVCRYSWSVDWSAGDDGRLTNVDAAFYAGCL